MPVASLGVICARSLRIQKSPIVIGPSVEFRRHRGWITVWFPILTGCVPTIALVSDMTKVEERVVGGFGAASRRDLGAMAVVAVAVAVEVRV